MQECNSPRNSRSQTHPDDERHRGEAVIGFALRPNKRTHRIDRSAHASKNSRASFGATVRGASRTHRQQRGGRLLILGSG